MKVLRKIGNFFVAMVPFWVYYAVQIKAAFHTRFSLREAR